jgi:hydroxymethylpyrimidine pyrophosphatase-like HAD family hydrolase
VASLGYRLVITDFDGTIKSRFDPVAERDCQALKEMGQAGLVRVVATGRSLVSFQRDWNPKMELDYLIYSSGLGLCRWTPTGPGEHIFGKIFNQEEQKLALAGSLALGWGFIAFKAPPNSHAFYYFDPPRSERTAGFEARLAQFKESSEPWPGHDPGVPLAQFLIMAPALGFAELRDRFQALASGLSVTQSSSPYEDDSQWLEIFPAGVSKGAASQALVELLGFDSSQAVAVGNDYNDEDLLAWAGRSFVVNNAPADLLAKFEPIKGGGSALAEVWRLIG